MQLSEQRAVAFAQAVHLLHHVGELLDVEGRDRGDFADLLRLVVVMGLGVMLVVESEFRIGNAVRRRADVGADASRVGLERQHVEVAHHLHVLAALVALRNLDLDGRRIGGVAFAGADAGLLQRRLFLAGFDGGDAAFHGAHAVQVFIQLLLVGVPAMSAAGPSRRRGPGPTCCRSRAFIWLEPPPRPCCSCLLNKRLSTLRGLISAGTACVGERKLQCE